MLHQCRREPEVAREHAEAVIALSREQGFEWYLAWGTTVRGWTLVEQGQQEEGIAQMRQGWAAYQATGAKMAGPQFLALLAEAYGRVGQREEGLAVVAEALAMGDTTEERYYDAELYRLKGMLTLQSQVPSPKPVLSLVEGSQVEETLPGRVGSAHHNVSIAEAGTVGGAHPTMEAEAEGYFLKAIEAAREQQARSLELRATVSLARLWRQQGKQKDAHQMLSEIYGWFTEGFDTKDLREAQSLLEELKNA
jgi:predicted ATPase